ncbi:MAG: discoidin domain-containing protein [Desulfomonile tiedjei]|uniref:Discoidin domain-containing protein n=1 Tax=Desulfomonile tiedjei TaxID=2358 RepID=A0A9D6Z6T0_9BACT|nr:discoidin domain-containing protein [Desulfomonile tiedjei]
MSKRKHLSPDNQSEAALDPKTAKQPSEPDQGPDTSNSVRQGFFRKFVWSWIKVPLYVVFLAASVVLIFVGLEKLAQWGLASTYLAPVYPKDLSMARRDFTMPVSHYDYDFVPGVCLEYNVLKGNRYEYANNAGFREPRDIPMVKHQDEFRVFLTGGSTAFGMGAIGEAAPAMDYYGIEYRETISHMMEMILNSSAPIPGKTIRVYNTAVWGYAYQHLLMRYMTKLRDYSPDLVISLDGANEIPIVSKLTEDWNYFKEGQFHNILHEIYAYNGAGLSSYLTLWLKNNSFLMTYFWSGKDLFQELNKDLYQHKGVSEQYKPDASSANLSVDEKSRLVDRNMSAVVRVVENYSAALKNDGVPHIIALQPWFYLCKKPKHDKEKILDSLGGYRQYYGVPSDKMYQLFLDKVRQSAEKTGYFLVDFSDYFDDVSEWVFTDWCHLTAGGNYLMAKELANLVKEHFLGMALTDGDKTSNKDSFFWDMAASGTVKYAPPADSPANGPEHILTGYPGESVYSASKVRPEDPMEVVLDMEESRPMSRLRLVWGDEASVPELWEIEYSVDGTDWKSFVKSTNRQTDSYSRWPGFEYYAAQPVQARYLKYKPAATAQRSISLRSWSVFR